MNNTKLESNTEKPQANTEIKIFYCSYGKHTFQKRVYSHVSKAICSEHIKTCELAVSKFPDRIS